MGILHLLPLRDGHGDLHVLLLLLLGLRATDEGLRRRRPAAQLGLGLQRRRRDGRHRDRPGTRAW